MPESRIIRLVKQFAADHQRVLAMSHVSKALAERGDSAHAFLVRGISRLTSLGRLQYAQANDLRREFHDVSHYTPEAIGRMDIKLRAMNISWEALAEAGESSLASGPSASANSSRQDAETRTYRRAFAEDNEAYSVFSDMFVDMFKDAMHRDAHFAEMADRLRRNDARTRGDAEPPMRQRYGRTNMPPSLTGLPVIQHDGTLKNGKRMLRIRLTSAKFTLLTELVAFGEDADTIADFAHRGEALMVIITVPEDIHQYPQARIMI